MLMLCGARATTSTSLRAGIQRVLVKHTGMLVVVDRGVGSNLNVIRTWAWSTMGVVYNGHGINITFLIDYN